MGKLSDTRQRNAVSEGFAIGLLAIGHHELDRRSPAYESAFARAWRGWAYSDRFPRVSLDLKRGLRADLVFTRATERKQTFGLYWKADGHSVLIEVRSDLDRQEPDLDSLAQVVDGDLDVPAWAELATAYIERLSPSPS